MAYIPSVNDIPEEAPYVPSLADIPQDNLQLSSPALNGMAAQQENMTGIMRPLADIAAGAASAGQGLHNFPYNAYKTFVQNPVHFFTGYNGNPFPNPTNINFSQQMGIPNPNFGDKLLQGATSYAPYAFMPGIMGDTGLAGQINAGGIYGATQSSDPVKGGLMAALSSAPGSLIGSGLGKGLDFLSGNQAGQDMAGNMILKNANKAAANGQVLTPSETSSLQSSAPYVQDLRGNATPTSFANNIKSSLYDLFTSNKKQAGDLFDSFKNATQDLSLSPNGQAANMTNYRAAAQDLLDKRDQLMSTYGSNTDFAPQLNSELNKANALLNPSTDNNQFNDALTDYFKNVSPEVMQKNQGLLQLDTAPSVPISTAMSRVQTLQKMAQNAYGSGKREIGQHFDSLADGLSQDTTNYLNNNGMGDIAQTLQNAKDLYKTNVVPFYKNPELQQTVTSKSYIPNTANLANELHDPNNSALLGALPNETKNGLLSRLIMGSKGTSSGALPANVDSKQIANNYSNLPDTTKEMVASYNPQADSYLEGLNQTLSQGKQTFNQYLNSERPGIGNVLKYAVPGLYAHSLAASMLGTVPKILGNRTFARAATNPDLVNAYVTGTKLPAQSAISPLISQLLNPLITPNAVPAGGQ